MKATRFRLPGGLRLSSTRTYCVSMTKIKLKPKGYKAPVSRPKIKVAPRRKIEPTGDLVTDLAILSRLCKTFQLTPSKPLSAAGNVMQGWHCIVYDHMNRMVIGVSVRDLDVAKCIAIAIERCQITRLPGQTKIIDNLK